MDRRAFIIVVGRSVVVAPTVVRAQRAEKVYRVGILGATPTPSLSEAFRLALRDLG